MRIYIKYVTRHLLYPCFSRNFVVTCSLWSRSMMLWSLHTESTTLNSRGIIFDVLTTYWSRYFNVTDTFCQFCGTPAFTVSMTLILA